MRKEYDVKKLKVKRRGMLPGLSTKEAPTNKVRITISLDKDVIDFFKSEANQLGAFPYQTQINQALRKIVDKQPETTMEDLQSLKKELLNDSKFIHKVAEKISHYSKKSG